MRMLTRLLGGASVRLGVLFIGCCDSIFAPETIFAEQAESFVVVRHPGSFVPPYEWSQSHPQSMADIESALTTHRVDHVVVCGHSHCRVCEAMYEPSSSDRGDWFELAERTKAFASIATQHVHDPQRLYRTTELLFVVQQLENLMTQPCVGERVRQGMLSLHGWYHVAEERRLEYYDESSGTFRPLGPEADA